MLARLALESLTHDLAEAIGRLGLREVTFGIPALVEKPAKDAEEMFQGYAKATANKEDAYAVARAFLRGAELDVWQRDMVASALCDPVREQSDAMVVGAKERFSNLLKSYVDEAKRGDLWRLTWHGLLYSYFNFDVSASRSDDANSGWEELREFLGQTWPLIDKQTQNDPVPAWVSVLRREREVLSKQPVEKYAKAFLAGDTDAIATLAADLGIPPSSWFWHALVLSAVKYATKETDAKYRARLPQLLDLIKSKPGFRDQALELILERYHACQGAPVDERLRDYVCQPTVWKNPKLKTAGIATAWNRVPEAVWRMVLAWVNEQNLKDFFDILAARNKADEGRLAFWSRYLKQISWTRLLFGADTMALQKANAEVRNLIAREEGSYAQLTGKPEVDAFMMQLGPYVLVEFSKKPNACYGYEADQLPFEPYDRYYNGGTSDLAAGYHAEVDYAIRIVHRAGWEAKAENDLLQLGIKPDAQSAPTVTRATRATAKSSATAKSTQTTKAKPGRPSLSKASTIHGGPDMSLLRALVGRFNRAIIDDRRNLPSGGRLWVADPLQRTQLSAELDAMGFEWSDRRLAWYFPENQ
jgi:hypothetical protein